MEGIWTFPSKLSRAGRVGIQNLLACISGFGDMEDCLVAGNFEDF
jgi:hypothetical protein